MKTPIEQIKAILPHGLFTVRRQAENIYEVSYNKKGDLSLIPPTTKERIGEDFRAYCAGLGRTQRDVRGDGLMRYKWRLSDFGCTAELSGGVLLVKPPDKSRKSSKMTPGELAKRGTEHGEQSAVFAWCALPQTRAKFPDASKLFAINNNAGNGDAIRGARAKMSGTRAGVADAFLPIARHGMHGLFLELKQKHFKTRKNGGLSEGQRGFCAQVRKDGFGFAAAYGWEHAAEILSQYLAP